MKKEDLIIGDWVTRRGVPEEHMRICGMNVLAGVVYLDQDGRGVTEKFENIEPIPLTTEILEKNGWILKEFGCHKQFQYSFEDYDTEIILKIDYEKPNFIVSFFRTSFELKYVNDLQHALKLCGIEKEIVL